MNYRTACKLYERAIGSQVGRGRAVLFGAPTHSNVGDQMILLGTWDYLQSIHNELITVNEFAEFQVKSSDVIYFLGGGNFGDLWYPVLLDKIRRMRTFDSNKVIFLPQSIFFRKHRNIVEIRKALDSYNGELSLFVRDQESKLIADDYLGIESRLLPDPAILLQTKLEKWVPHSDGDGILYVRREDKESKRKFNFNLPTSDIMIAGIPFQPELSVRLVGSLIAARKLIITDRLHAAILAVMVGRHAILLPNRYHKNESFYNTWSLPRLSFARTKRDISVQTNEALSGSLKSTVKREMTKLLNRIQ